MGKEAFSRKTSAGGRSGLGLPIFVQFCSRRKMSSLSAFPTSPPPSLQPPHALDSPAIIPGPQSAASPGGRSRTPLQKYKYPGRPQRSSPSKSPMQKSVTYGSTDLEAGASQGEGQQPEHDPYAEDEDEDKPLYESGTPYFPRGLSSSSALARPARF